MVGEDPHSFQVDLTNCDREPIHRLGRVQGFGFLIGLSADWIISHVSENAGAFTGLEPQALLGEPATRLLTPDAIHALRNRLQHVRPGGHPEIVQSLVVENAVYDVSIHVSNDTIILEFEPNDKRDDITRHISDVQQAITRMSRLPTIDAVLKFSVRFAAAISGFDRVMAYVFRPDLSGEVVAEAAVAGLDPFLGLRYPASDIPAQARELYVRNPVRSIADVSEDGYRILPVASRPDQMLDLSNAVLRSVSPMHLEYLRNMGVGASMSVSLLINGKLWGLLALHNADARALPQAQRNAVLLFGQMLSLLIEGRLAQEDNRFQEEAADLLSAVSRSAASRAGVNEMIIARAEYALKIMSADGLAVITAGHVETTGTTPDSEALRLIAKRLNTLPSSRVHATSELQSLVPEAETFAERGAGMLAIPISKSPRDYILFFRREIKKTISWAGNPEKPVIASGPNGARLTPRASFEVYKTTVKGQSEEWSPSQIRAAEQFRITVLEVVLRLADEAAEERRRASEKQELLIAELNHRVRNILNLVRSLIAQTSPGQIDTAEFARVLEARIQALSRAHDQITRENWSPAPLKRLIETESEGYLLDRADRLLINGDDVMLAPAAYSNLALVIHELMTNSAKYGSLSDRRGTVVVHLTRRSDQSLDIHWSEKGGPVVKAPTRRGFGTTIIERSIPYELNGTADVEYRMEGVVARFWIPAPHIKGTPKAAPETKSLAEPSDAALALEMPDRLLLLEDNLIIALDVEEVLTDLGIKKVTVCGEVASALAAVDEGVDCAMLDINLGSETSFPVAEALLERGIPFVFASGYGDATSLPASLAETPILSKPYDREAIVRSIRSVMPGSAPSRPPQSD
ncbi:HWE histidine kinase domain-containing protein [Pseudohoeflea coraliihabitans]|uniref:histidine kinase n=1 Tax=Pseudohoeflea coraliihabitans TaxID=2860393 RepID=A0ABS6WMW2_9HYPH|nr:HWE histidine kinase domain-containing protein [Pseudohoeflea sp. DP4N28-3]MBW3096404.1 GAF domain-containing protein [Pseudohoeflea sp. DP4N28-3]